MVLSTTSTYFEYSATRESSTGFDWWQTNLNLIRERAKCEDYQQAKNLSTYIRNTHVSTGEMLICPTHEDKI